MGVRAPPAAARNLPRCVFTNTRRRPSSVGVSFIQGLAEDSEARGGQSATGAPGRVVGGHQFSGAPAPRAAEAVVAGVVAVVVEKVSAALGRICGGHAVGLGVAGTLLKIQCPGGVNFLYRFHHVFSPLFKIACMRQLNIS